VKSRMTPQTAANEEADERIVSSTKV